MTSKTEKTMRYECWIGPDDQTFSTVEGCRDMRKRGIIPKTSKKVFSIKADSWVAAMTAYHEFMGWGPYVPMKED